MPNLTTVVDSFKDDFEKFSNFYPVVICYEAMSFPTVEHAFVAAKSKDILFRSRISRLLPKQAGKAKRMGRPKSKGGVCVLRQDWDLMKVSVMRIPGSLILFLPK